MAPKPKLPPGSTRTPWAWIPSLYFAQGLPYVAVMTLAVVMYKNLGVSNTDIALYTSWLYLPWVIKPLWSTLVDTVRTKRFWIISLQLVVGAALASIALALPGPGFFRATLAVFWLLAFSSATHDIAADGFYLLALDSHRQAAFVGVRSTFYRFAMIGGQGGLVYLAGWLVPHAGGVVAAWSWVFGGLGAAFVLLSAYHAFALPRPPADVMDRGRPARNPEAGSPSLAREFFTVFAAFFRRPGIGAILSFLLLYRLAEAQLLKLVTPFLLDPREAGGLGLTTQDVGIAYGTVGVIALTVGGLLGGFVASRVGLKRALWPMLFIMHAPNAMFVLLAWLQPSNLWLVSAAVAVEQFGYGFGFTAYLLYMMLVAEGSHRTAHYALCTGFMALGMMLPGMAAGWIQDHIGYLNFFIWVCVAALPSFIAAAYVKIDPAFGRRA